jgi:PAS domain S-box-containing protein
MKIIFYHLICISFLFNSYAGYCQTTNAFFERITTKDGLSQSTVNSIIQDKEGFMWFATFDGINRYDGYNFKIFRNITNDKNSISHNGSVYIYQDKSGYIWVVNNGNEGLNRFDPKTEKFTRFKFAIDDSLSISSNEIYEVKEDRDGNLWATTKNALNLLISKTENGKTTYKFRRYYYPFENNNNIKLYENKHGELLLISDYIYYFDKKHSKFSNSNIFINNLGIVSVCEDKTGNLWIGTVESGIIKLEYNAAKKDYKKQTLDEINIAPHERNFVITDSKSNIWIATLHGLYQYNEKNHLMVHYSNDKNNLNSISDNALQSLYIDSFSVLWVGTFSQGLCKLDMNHKPFFHYKADNKSGKSLSGNVISSIHSRNTKELWVGLDLGGGINRLIFDGAEIKQINRYLFNRYGQDSLNISNILSLVQRRNGDVWAGSAGSFITKLTPEKAETDRLAIKKIYKLERWTFSIFEDSKGILWGGTWGNGLWKFDDKTEKFTFLRHIPDDSTSICDEIIWSLYEDTNGNLWIGGHGGGLSILPVNEKYKTNPKFINYKYNEDINSSLSNNTIHVIFQDHLENMWIGTNGGLNKAKTLSGNFKNIEKDKIIFNSYHIKDGLPSETTVGILEDNKGNLWLSTSKGISKFNPKNGLITNFDEKDGLQGNEFWHNSYFKDYSGKMYFGGNNGLNSFYPDSIKPNEILPKIVFNGLKIFNQPVDIGQQFNGDIILPQSINETSKIVLSHANNAFTIEFAALHYVQPSKIGYAYKLDGFDNTWNYVGNKRDATYTNLNPGEYTFTVIASNNDNIWNNKGISIKILVLPPWWKTWWFKLIDIFIILTGFIVIILSIIRKVKKQANQTILNERNQLKTLIDNIPDRVIIKDTKSRFLIINNAAVKYFGGKSANEFIYKTDFDLHPKELAEKFYNEELEILSTKIPIINKEETRIVGGKESYVSITKCPIINLKAETIGIVCIIKDITFQKTAELELKKQSKELENYNFVLSETNVLLEERQQQIEEQSEELRVSNERLIEHQSRIEEQSEELMAQRDQLSLLNTTKTKLFSILAHDLRSPFNALIGFSELLIRNLKKYPVEKIETQLNHILNTSRQTYNMLNNLLEWSRSQREIIQFCPELINLRDYLSTELKILRQQATRKKIILEEEIIGNERKVNADPNLISTVFRNLISNAIKYSFENSSIKIVLIYRENDFQFTVTDNGTGISPVLKETLFKISDIASTSGTSGERGTGLGLLICADFIAKHSGKIWVESEINKGSTFFFEIPYQ